MKTKEIISRSDRELETLIRTTREDIVKRYTELRTSQVSNVKQIHVLKRTLARALTIERQRAIAAELTNNAPVVKQEPSQ